MPSASPELAPPGADDALVAVVLLVGRIRLDVTLPAHLTLAELVREVNEVVVRAGATAPTSPVLAPLGRAALPPGTTLHEGGVRDGDVLVLQTAAARPPLTVHHQVQDAVGAVAAGHPTVSAEHLRAAALVGLAGWALVLAALAPALGAWGPLLCAAVGLGSAAAVLAPGPTVGAATRAVCAGILVVHAGWSGLLCTASGVVVPAACGAGGGLLVAGAWVSWARPGLREWAVLPVLVGAVLLLAGAPGALGRPVELGTVVTAAALVLLGGSGLLRVWVVDAVLLRRGAEVPVQGVSEAPTPVREQVTPERVLATGRVLLALDVAVLVVWCLATPTLVRGPVSAVLLWGAGVGLLLLRGRSEHLLSRAVVAWTSGLVLLALGLGLALVGPAPGWTPVVTWTATGVCLATLAPLAVLLRGRVASPHAARLASVAELSLRVAAPSLWVVQSGLLPGGGL